MSERDKDGILVREREIVAGAMMNKLRDNISKGATVNKECLNLKGIVNTLQGTKILHQKNPN